MSQKTWMQLFAAVQIRWEHDNTPHTQPIIIAIH